MVRTRLQPLPVHAATITPVTAAAQSPAPFCILCLGAQVPSWVWSDYPGSFTPSLVPHCPQSRENLDADLASRGLHSQVSANSFTLNSHPLLLRTRKFQEFPSFSIYKVCRKHLPVPGTVLIFFYIHSLIEFPNI